MTPVMENVRIFLQGLAKTGMFARAEPFRPRWTFRTSNGAACLGHDLLRGPTEAKGVGVSGCSSPQGGDVQKPKHALLLLIFFFFLPCILNLC